MKPAINTSVDNRIPFPEVIPLIRAAGFESVMIGGNPQHSGYTTASGRAEIRRLLRDHGMTIDSVHAPFPEGDRLFALDEQQRRESLELCLDALDATEELDGRVMMIHLLLPYGIPPGDIRVRMIDQGRRSIETLAAGASERGVKLALENGQKQAYDDVLEQLMGEFDVPQVGFCYDTGHEHVKGSCFQLLEKYGSRLVAVHVHDNKGSDTHELPFDGTIDWDRFRSVLHALDFDGDLTLEVHFNEGAPFPDPSDFLAEAFRRAEKLLPPREAGTEGE